MQALSGKIEVKAGGVISTVPPLINTIFYSGENSMTAKTISKICSVDGCRQPKTRRVYCNKHYMRLHRNGSLDIQPQLSETYQTPFWDRVTISDLDQCWEWKLGVDKDGYGVASFNARPVRAHRLAYYFTHGKWPELTRHTCDNPPCCNPNHLLDGTAKDNSRDMVDRGRSAQGENHGHSKLTTAEVAVIRRTGILFKTGSGKGSGFSQKALASKYGVSRRVIKLILEGEAWKHVT